MWKRIFLVQMEIGERGRIIEIQGGARMSLRLENLGIRVGEEIKKISQQAMRGPAVVEAGKSQVAIGFGIASRILVEVEEGKEINENSSNG
ncbi:MAG: FeoA family protein [bacterium]